MFRLINHCITQTWYRTAFSHCLSCLTECFSSNYEDISTISKLHNGHMSCANVMQNSFKGFTILSFQPHYRTEGTLNHIFVLFLFAQMGFCLYNVSLVQRNLGEKITGPNKLKRLCFLCVSLKADGHLRPRTLHYSSVNID